MKTIWNNIYSFYSNWLHPTFDSLIIFFSNNQYAIYIAVAVLIVLSIVKKVVLKGAKVQTLSKLIDFITFLLVMLLIVVAYTSFAPAVSKFIKSNASINTNSSTPTKSTPKSTTGTESAPSTQTTKQLYYGGGCSGCYADGCPSNGYSYGGYDVNMYNYYRSLCQVCQCTSLRWQSLWR